MNTVQGRTIVWVVSILLVAAGLFLSGTERQPGAQAVLGLAALSIGLAGMGLATFLTIRSNPPPS